MSLRIDTVLGPAWVQDLGRPGHMHEGMPWGGALVPELAMAANAAVGNPVTAPVIEFFGTLVVDAMRPLSQDGRLLPAGAAVSLRPPPGQRVSYLAVAGGVQVAPCMGGSGTFVTAGMGGFQGRALRRGDVLPLAPAGPVPQGARGRIAAPVWDAQIPVCPGPDRALFAEADWDTLLAATWYLKEPSDRTGTRLQGPALQPRTAIDAQSVPMVMGAVQVPPDGAPIVLGPDHPVTGGYPVLAVVARAALGSLQGRPIGAPVRFTAALQAQALR